MVEPWTVGWAPASLVVPSVAGPSIGGVVGSLTTVPTSSFRIDRVSVGLNRIEDNVKPRLSTMYVNVGVTSFWRGYTVWILFVIALATATVSLVAGQAGSDHWAPQFAFRVALYFVIFSVALPLLHHYWPASIAVWRKRLMIEFVGTVLISGAVGILTNLLTK